MKQITIPEDTIYLESGKKWNNIRCNVFLICYCLHELRETRFRINRFKYVQQVESCLKSNLIKGELMRMGRISSTQDVKNNLYIYTAQFQIHRITHSESRNWFHKQFASRVTKSFTQIKYTYVYTHTRCINTHTSPPVTIKRSLSIDLFHFDVNSSLIRRKIEARLLQNFFPTNDLSTLKNIAPFDSFHNSKRFATKRNEKKKISNEIQVLFSKLTRHGWGSPAGRWRTSMNIRRCTPFCPILSPLTPTNWPNIAKLTRTDEPRVVQPLHVARPPYFPRGIPERNWTWAGGSWVSPSCASR